MTTSSDWPPASCLIGRHDGEAHDLRNLANRRLPADPLAYESRARPAKETRGLPFGSQAKFIASTEVAANLGYPLNVLLTLRWSSLFCGNGVTELRVLPTPDRIRHLVERIRKWQERNGIPCYYIWVREAVPNEGEHWHMALHIPQKKRAQFAGFIEKLAGEPALKGKRPPQRRTQGEFACGEMSSWHLANDTQPDRNGIFLAAYLGKGEPSQRSYRGRVVENRCKPFRGKSFGGSYEDGRFDNDQGAVAGTVHRKDRFYISNALKRAATKAQ